MPLLTLSSYDEYGGDRGVHDSLTVKGEEDSHVTWLFARGPVNNTGRIGLLLNARSRTDSNVLNLIRSVRVSLTVPPGGRKDAFLVRCFDDWVEFDSRSYRTKI